MIIIGIDPGKTTGLAWGDTELMTTGGAEISFDDFGDWLNTSLARLKAEGKDVRVACERFTIAAGTIKKSQDAHWALEAIGVARYISRCYGVEFIMQHPSDVKGAVSDEKLKKAGWYIPGKGHANDALRHVSMAMIHFKIRPPWV
jgi:hypothetical protein